MKLLVSILIIFLNINTSFSQSEQERYDLVQKCVGNFEKYQKEFVDCLNDIINNDPSNMYAFIERGDYYRYEIPQPEEVPELPRGKIIVDSLERKTLNDYNQAFEIYRELLNDGIETIVTPFNYHIYSFISAHNFFKNFNTQIEFLDSMYSSNPHDISCPDEKSKILFRELNDTVGSINVWNNFIKNNPNYLYAYQALSELKAKILDFEGAIVVLENASKIDPKNSLVILERAGYRKRIGDFIGALKDYNELIILYPKSSNYNNNRGNLKSIMGDHMGAMSDYNQGIEYSNSDFEKSSLYHNRSNLKLDLGDYRGALIDINKSIELDKNNQWCGIVRRGHIYYAMGKYKLAISDYKNSLECAHDDEIKFIHYWSGFAKYSIGDLEGACMDWSKAGELGMEEAYDAIKEHCN